MINRVDRRKIKALPKAHHENGVCLCPLCWHPLCEPLEGEGSVAIRCRMCKRHVVVELEKHSTP